MVWGYNIIIFLYPQKKCDQYWPNSGKETYKNYEVTLMDTSQYANYSVRKLQVVRVSRHADDRRNNTKSVDSEANTVSYWCLLQQKNH